MSRCYLPSLPLLSYTSQHSWSSSLLSNSKLFMPHHPFSLDAPVNVPPGLYLFWTEVTRTAYNIWHEISPTLCIVTSLSSLKRSQWGSHFLSLCVQQSPSLLDYSIWAFSSRPPFRDDCQLTADMLLIITQQIICLLELFNILSFILLQSSQTSSSSCATIQLFSVLTGLPNFTSSAITPSTVLLPQMKEKEQPSSNTSSEQ